MRARTRVLVICALLVATVLSLRVGGVAAQAETATVDTAAVNTLTVDTAARTITSGPIFTPGEAIAFWFDVPSGGAGGLTTADSTGTITAASDGSLNATISADDWRQLPRSATHIVAHGITSGVEAVYTLPASGLDLSLHVDTTSHAISAAPIFSPDEQIVFWYNRADGTAASFEPQTGNATYATSDGTLAITADGDAWSTLPANLTSIVAHGLRSDLTVVYIFPAQ